VTESPSKHWSPLWTFYLSLKDVIHRCLTTVARCTSFCCILSSIDPGHSAVDCLAAWFLLFPPCAAQLTVNYSLSLTTFKKQSIASLFRLRGCQHSAFVSVCWLICFNYCYYYYKINYNIHCSVRSWNEDDELMIWLVLLKLLYIAIRLVGRHPTPAVEQKQRDECADINYKLPSECS